MYNHVNYTELLPLKRAEFHALFHLAEYNILAVSKGLFSMKRNYFHSYSIAQLIRSIRRW